MASGLEKQHIEITPGVLRRQAAVAGTRIRCRMFTFGQLQGKTADAIVADFHSFKWPDVCRAGGISGSSRPKLSSKCRPRKIRRQNTPRSWSWSIGLEAPSRRQRACSGFILTKAFLQPSLLDFAGAAIDVTTAVDAQLRTQMMKRIWNLHFAKNRVLVTTR